ncbi:MAG: hypothetical protein ACLQDL_02525 [Spirochaetia bacterium]
MKAPCRKSFTAVHFARPSFTIGNAGVRAFVSIQGGQCTASFTSGRTSLDPHFVAPWWSDAPFLDLDPVLQGLRGDFFCFPFGANAEPVGGVKYPTHGLTANACWNFLSIADEGPEKKIVLFVDLAPDKGMVRKEISLRDGEPVVYSRHVVDGFKGRMPFGHHPNIQCSERQGSALVDMTPSLAGFTAPVPLGTPENKGYSLLMPGVEFENLAKVPTKLGDTVDLTSYPITKGYEDGVLLISDPTKEFVFTSLSEREKGFLYFQLKNPKVLSQTLLWMPLGGNYTPPFNGRVRDVLGMEEVTGNFFYGRKASIESNAISDHGYPTYREFTEAAPTEVSFIWGVIPIGRDFRGVSDIVRKNATEIRVLGKGGEKLDIPCQVDFLKEPV